MNNSLDTGIILGTAELSANYIISVDKKEVFHKTYKIKHEWESLFMADRAIPDILQNYPIAIGKLIDKFLLDEDVIKILKK